MIVRIAITITEDSDALVGAEGWDGYDALQSTAKLTQNIANRVGKAYPGARVTVNSELLYDDRIYITTDDGEDTESDEDDIRQIISDVWQDWDAWAVEEE